MGVVENIYIPFTQLSCVLFSLYINKNMKIFLSVASGVLDIAQRRLQAAAGREQDVKKAWLIHTVWPYTNDNIIIIV